MRRNPKRSWILALALTGGVVGALASSKVPHAKEQALTGAPSGTSAQIFHTEDSYQSIDDGIGVVTTVCVSPVLFGTDGETPLVVVHVDHEILRIEDGQRLGHLHLHRVVEAFGTEAITGSLGGVRAGDETAAEDLDLSFQTAPVEPWSAALLDESSQSPAATTSTITVSHR